MTAPVHIFCAKIMQEDESGRSMTRNKSSVSLDYEDILRSKNEIALNYPDSAFDISAHQTIKKIRTREMSWIDPSKKVVDLITWLAVGTYGNKIAHRFTYSLYVRKAAHPAPCI